MLQAPVWKFNPMPNGPRMRATSVLFASGGAPVLSMLKLLLDPTAADV
jgi:hypothetical protein